VSQLERLFAGELPKLVMFDLDGTLLDSVPDLAAAVDTMLIQIGRSPADIEDVREWVGNGALVLVQRALAGRFDYSGVSEAEAEPALQLFLQAYAQESSRSQVYSGVLDTLAALKDKGIKLAIITNKPEQFLPELLHSHGLANFFDWVVGGDTLPEKKPDPAGLQWVMQQAGVTPEQSLFVGDSKNDIQAAKAAEVSCVALSYGYNHGQPIELEEPALVIDSLSELLQ